MSWLVNRRRGVGTKKAAGLIVEFVGNNVRADNYSNGQIQTVSYSGWFVIKITFPNYLTGALTFSSGGSSTDTNARWVFIKDGTLSNRPVTSPNPRTITPNSTPNVVFASIRLSSKETAYLKDKDGNYLWNGATEDWSRFNL